MSKPQTLDAITNAMRTIDAASQDPFITPELQAQLDAASNQLQEIQDTIVESAEDALIEALKPQTEKLDALNKEINELTEKLAGIGAAIKKISNVVGVVVNVLTAAISAGVL